MPPCTWVSPGWSRGWRVDVIATRPPALALRNHRPCWRGAAWARRDRARDSRLNRIVCDQGVGRAVHRSLRARSPRCGPAQSPAHLPAGTTLGSKRSGDGVRGRLGGQRAMGSSRRRPTRPTRPAVGGRGDSAGGRNQRDDRMGARAPARAGDSRTASSASRSTAARRPVCIRDERRGHRTLTRRLDDRVCRLDRGEEQPLGAPARRCRGAAPSWHRGRRLALSGCPMAARWHLPAVQCSNASS